MKGGQDTHAPSEVCAAVDCAVGGIYLTTDGKQCLTCTDPFAETCNSTTTFTCGTNFNLVDGKCVYGNPYGQIQGYGLSKPYLPKQQPFRGFQPDDLDPQNCVRVQKQARVIYYTGNADGAKKCTGQNGPLCCKTILVALTSTPKVKAPSRDACAESSFNTLDQNLVKTADETAMVLLPGNCSELSKSAFVAANKAACKQVYIGRLKIPT
ncbi:BZ3500_MvSof-1268-A1-R1_Chr1-3g01714 [Microbotryum saponariae]|uniref:BZ3500_MvSof-1268-A1-R1_Chr1-3g01714 protein n=1 Tax=Microbotryum saponariae TaxID=289078 RepID=A0A2X0KB25_9BASI|nr:BZ3500_MvSof-1268-A1-R1_Chr1-3g01714 [Microbotryum saponariae]SCZ94408.1 BZ3501_MvSof-1269-A2-R1_Chr1-3g01315 [Microbotryum saponariae]